MKSKKFLIQILIFPPNLTYCHKSITRARIIQVKHEKRNQALHHLLLINDQRKQIFFHPYLRPSQIHPHPRRKFRGVSPARVRARRAALSRGWCAFDGRRPLVVEFVSSSRKVRSPRRAPVNVVPPRLLSFRPPGETEQWRGCLHSGVFLPTNNPFFPVSASRLWTTVFRVLTIGGNRSRVTVCRSGVWTMLQSVIVEGDRRGWEKKGMIVRARYSVLPLLVKRPLPGEGNREWTVVCKLFEGGSSGMLERNGLWILWGAPRTRSPVIEKRCFEECVVCCDLFPLLSFLCLLWGKYFCLRVYVLVWKTLVVWRRYALNLGMD